MSEEKKESHFEFNYKGRIVRIGEVQSFSSGFKKREIVIDKAPPNADYPNPVPFCLNKDDADKADSLKVGQTVTVHGFINGREWTNPKDGKVKYFCDLVIFGKIEVDDSAGVVETPPEKEAQEDEKIPDDMPF